MKSIFISHRRNNGQATTEAILIKNLLAKDTVSRVFMDVTEDYLGPFPKTLKEKIFQSDTFILILPKAQNYDYLCDPDNWVYKEIAYALTFKDTINKPSRIIPVVFDRDFVFPPKEKLGDIADITDYSFIYFDTNSKDSAEKLIRATGVMHRSTKNWIYALGITLVILLGVFIFFLIPSNHTEELESEYRYPASIEFVNQIDRFRTFNSFTDSCGSYTKDYLAWYLSELNTNKDPAINAEFNKVYVKEYSIRLIVFAYLALTARDLSIELDKTLSEELINKCYESIPEEARYPISLKQMSDDDRKAKFGTILDRTIDTLNSDPRLQSVDESMLSVLKLTLIGRLWPE